MLFDLTSLSLAMTGWAIFTAHERLAVAISYNQKASVKSNHSASRKVKT
jgi:hypothetical protein